jgi:hypothetical protein
MCASVGAKSAGIELGIGIRISMRLLAEGCSEAGLVRWVLGVKGLSRPVIVAGGGRQSSFVRLVIVLERLGRLDQRLGVPRLGLMSHVFLLLK